MKKGLKRRLLTALIVVVALGALVGLTLFTAVCVSAGWRHEASPSDCIIVLGARVWEDGSPSSTVIYRCESALSAWRAGLAPVMILCGGQGGNEPMTEAEAMRRWLSAQGVPEAAMILEETSANTRQNLENAHGIMRERGYATAAVCTSDYHLRRALWMAQDEGIDACGIAAESPHRPGTWVVNRMRETCSWILYFFRRL